HDPDLPALPAGARRPAQPSPSAAPGGPGGVPSPPVAGRAILLSILLPRPGDVNDPSFPLPRTFGPRSVAVAVYWPLPTRSVGAGSAAGSGDRPSERSAAVAAREWPGTSNSGTRAAPAPPCAGSPTKERYEHVA